jgi:uncharacterized protein YjiS (DUF1127 family)
LKVNMSYVIPGPCDLSRPTVAGQRARPAGFPLVGSLRWLADQWRRLAIIHELRRLDDRLLRDIGIGRGEIEEFTDAMLTEYRHSQQARRRR